ncbi:MAG TPA: macro domain-containing protein [Dehalococcoidia bacterium]|nr:macro domain-containing protein [Dehalococcoidia bacterium]
MITPNPNQALHTHTRPDGRWLVAVQGDITEEEVDAIVNAANEALAHGGGVAGAIVRKGGRVIQEESDRWVQERGRVPTGSAAVTGAGSLKARHVIHAVGPVWGSGNEEALLASAVASALARAEELELSSVSLPAISTGIFGFPKELGVQVIVRAVQEYLDAHPQSSLQEVRFCNIDRATSELLLRELERLTGA